MQKRDYTQERWKDIPNTGGLYQVSTEGRVRRLYPKSGTTKLLKLYAHKHGTRQSRSNTKTLKTHVQTADGKRVEYSVLRLVAETFIGIPKGMFVVHKNGMFSDNSLANVRIVTREELSNDYTGGANRKPVAKIDRDGNVVTFYASAREAARHNPFSYQAIMDRCNGKRKREFEDWDYSFRWDDG